MIQHLLDGLSVKHFVKDGVYELAVGEHAVTLGVHTGYNGSGAVIALNGSTVVTADMAEFVLTASGATHAVTPTLAKLSEKDDSLGITECLLIALAIRMMRS